jgi:hypothetical protein
VASISPQGDKGCTHHFFRATAPATAEDEQDQEYPPAEEAQPRVAVVAVARA